MTNEKLNTKLYEKLFEEQEKYRGWLLSQPPEEILNHTYEYTVREDILLAVEYENFSDKQCRTLLKSPCPLADGRVWTVEGNSGDSCRENSYSLGYYEILGYGAPAY